MVRTTDPAVVVDAKGHMTTGEQDRDQPREGPYSGFVTATMRLRMQTVAYLIHIAKSVDRHSTWSGAATANLRLLPLNSTLFLLPSASRSNTPFVGTREYESRAVTLCLLPSPIHSTSTIFESVELRTHYEAHPLLRPPRTRMTALIRAAHIARFAHFLCILPPCFSLSYLPTHSLGYVFNYPQFTTVYSSNL
ncbi:hypothetical protein BS47DRAFT_1390869 [Hydnum rufescens UP504]|uniref:Uncharacterized protein n=1 Tax=Hydnum rufescens UP504 TaxID=1448309 RepID=A0A9P6DVB4_9AGAM|nr:hypothetical protein BS47DRAFT_1390869 [Hydnum rufescens UP504]